MPIALTAVDERAILLRIAREVLLDAPLGSDLMLAVCPLADLAPGSAVRVDVDPPIAVFRTDDGSVYAIDDTCTHQDASLAEGWLEGCAVECPLHASRFDLRTGAADMPPAKVAVRTHRVEIVDGVICVEAATASSPHEAG